MFNLVLVQPDIPHNTGAIGRLCLSTNSTLHLIKPLGFDLSDKAIRRAGLDYWPHVQQRVWKSLDEFLTHIKITKPNCYFLTTKTDKPYWRANFKKGDYLIFGSETRGLPQRLLDANMKNNLTIPMDRSHVRSLNLATAAGIVLFEGMKQVSEAS